MTYKLLAHRANINGANPDRENTVDYIIEALDRGFMVEVDVYKMGQFLYLGHDEDKLKEDVDLEFLENPDIIVHSKTAETFNFLSRNPKIHTFFQDDENEVVTNQGLIWNHSKNKKQGEYRILTFLDDYNGFVLKYSENVDCWGICTDYPMSFKEKR